jgi:hypothetical protein
MSTESLEIVKDQQTTFDSFIRLRKHIKINKLIEALYLSDK